MLTLQPIDYIGSPPRKQRKRPGRRNLFGGWFLLLLAVGIGCYFVHPLLPFLKAQQAHASKSNARQAIKDLTATGGFNEKLAAAALARTGEEVSYDPAYYDLAYPGGDLPAHKGISSDLVVRSYRTLGVDLQKLVHEDMREHFRLYPQLWKLRKPDSNIDHRRIPNLQRFFSRFGKELPATQLGNDYQFGDVVAWRLPFASEEHAASHIGIVVPGPGARKDERWVVHNIGSGPEWEDELFSYQIVGHYRFSPSGEAHNVTADNAGPTTALQN